MRYITFILTIDCKSGSTFSRYPFYVLFPDQELIEERVHKDHLPYKNIAPIINLKYNNSVDVS